MAVGSHDDYIAHFQGLETTTTNPCPTKIYISEGSIGVEVPFIAGLGIGLGFYSTANGESGFFVFAQAQFIGEYGSLGFGFGF